MAFSANAFFAAKILALASVMAFSAFVYFSSIVFQRSTNSVDISSTFSTLFLHMGHVYERPLLSHSNIDSASNGCLQGRHRTGQSEMNGVASCSKIVVSCFNSNPPSHFWGKAVHRINCSRVIVPSIWGCFIRTLIIPI